MFDVIKWLVETFDETEKSKNFFNPEKKNTSSVSLKEQITKKFKSSHYIFTSWR